MKKMLYFAYKVALVLFCWVHICGMLLLQIQNLYTLVFLLSTHSSEIRGLRSTKCSSETLQNVIYFMYKKTHVVFFVFHFVQLYIFTLWMPWSMSNFEAFWWNISLSTNLLFMKSVHIKAIVRILIVNILIY